MDADKIAQAFKSAGMKTITCPEAFSIAAKYRIPKKEISEYCNAHGIKIRGFQLGCFKWADHIGQGLVLELATELNNYQELQILLGASEEDPRNLEAGAQFELRGSVAEGG